VRGTFGVSDGYRAVLERRVGAIETKIGDGVSRTESSVLSATGRCGKNGGLCELAPRPKIKT
jgi:hypothetical protein